MPASVWGSSPTLVRGDYDCVRRLPTIQHVIPGTRTFSPVWIASIIPWRVEDREGAALLNKATSLGNPTSPHQTAQWRALVVPLFMWTIVVVLLWMFHGTSVRFHVVWDITVSHQTTKIPDIDMMMK